MLGGCRGHRPEQSCQHQRQRQQRRVRPPPRPSSGNGNSVVHLLPLLLVWPVRAHASVSRKTQRSGNATKSTLTDPEFPGEVDVLDLKSWPTRACMHVGRCRRSALLLHVGTVVRVQRRSPVQDRTERRDSPYCPCLMPGSPAPLLTSGASWAFFVMPTGRTGLPATPSNIRALAVYQAQTAETINV